MQAGFIRRFQTGLWVLVAVLGFTPAAWAGRAASGPRLLIPMDDSQRNHLRAYGLVFDTIKQGVKGELLLNYRGGSFLIEDRDAFRNMALAKGVTYDRLGTGAINSIYRAIENENMDVVDLEKAPKIAVYTPPNKDPWDDAVTLALTYAQIPYDTIWDEDVLAGKLSQYDWLHLHHEDFTGQMGKFYGSFRFQDWYIQKARMFEQAAKSHDYKSVHEFKKAVAEEIARYVENGGFLFAMCGATDTLDIALAAKGLDVVAPELDGTPLTPGFAQKLAYERTFAFTNFKLITSPYIYEFSDIDAGPQGNVDPTGLMLGKFSLFEFSAKLDPVLSILVQNHRNAVNAFLGQSTAFRRDLVKRSVYVLGEEDDGNVRYLHGNRGKGAFTFLGGHDPEDFAHLVGEKPTNLDLYPNSPGYRLILNNVLLPAVRKKEKKT